MAAYFKELEPDSYHSLHNKLDELKPFKLSKAVMDYLQGKELHFELKDCDFKWIEFFSLTDTVAMKKGRAKFLRLSKATGDYDHICIVWNPKTKKVAFCVLFINTLYKTTELSGKTIRQVVHKNIQ